MWSLGLRPTEARTSLINNSSDMNTLFDLRLNDLINHVLNITTYECSIGTLLLIKPTQSNGATGMIPITMAMS